MSATVGSSLKNCKGCSQPMRSPIIQCQEGHSVCGSCSEKKKCSICGHSLTKIRNRQLEELIEQLMNVTLKTHCKFASRGCKYELELHEKESHELECKSRIYECEGKAFCGWDCDWKGGYVDILKHFETSHDIHCWMEFKTEFSMQVNMKRNLTDIQIIDFKVGQQLFWYKHKMDVEKKKAYWTFQYVGLQKQAAQYYYEFEVYKGIRKIKITEICENDCQDAEVSFSSGKCIAIPFKVIRNYLNDEGKLSIRFRIMKMKKDSLK